MQICKTEEFVSINTKKTLDTLDTTQAGISHDSWHQARQVDSSSFHCMLHSTLVGPNI
jgi:hypothetical protein